MVNLSEKFRVKINFVKIVTNSLQKIQTNSHYIFFIVNLSEIFKG